MPGRPAVLDLTRSIFAGLHFATISWEGDINEDTDGILYVLTNANGSWTQAAHGLLATSPDAAGLSTAYSGWPAPEYFRIYESTLSANPREVAQDGVFCDSGIGLQLLTRLLMFQRPKLDEYQSSSWLGTIFLVSFLVDSRNRSSQSAFGGRGKQGRIP